MMLAFVTVSMFCLLALFFLLSYHRFIRGPGGSYLSWLQSRIPIVIKTPWVHRFKETYRNWFIPRYAAGQRWVILGLAASYVYLALSGFVFAFISVRLFGFFLLLHVVLGALFAVCLSLAVLWRARFYVWHEADGAPANLHTEEGKRRLWQVIVFWVFVVSGLLLTTTALCQMLPSFSLRSQLMLFEVHRYSALAVLLAGIAFLYFSLDDEAR